MEFSGILELTQVAVCKILSHTPDWNDRETFTLGVMYCMHLSCYMLISVVLESKDHTEKEFPVVSSFPGCNKKLNFCHFQVESLVFFNLDTHCRLRPLTAKAVGLERCFAVYHCVCWDTDASDALVEWSRNRSYPVSNHYAILLYI